MDSSELLRLRTGACNRNECVVNPICQVGAQGEQGPAGSQGPQGLPGLPGAAGREGEVGPPGPQGDQGLQGPPGGSGPTGYTGPQGEQGIQGDIGPQGAQGDIGPQGAQGDIGPQGAQGDIGPQGSQGESGATGPTGPTGPQGIEGSTGYTGPQGAIGQATNVAASYYSMEEQFINISTDTPTVFQFERTSVETGIHKNAGNTQMVVETTGIYEVWYSLQLHSWVSQDVFTYIWLRINGIDVPDSNGRVETKSNTSDSLPIVPYILNLNAGDTVSFVAQTNAPENDDISGLTLSGVPGPDVPSIIVGIKQIAVDIGVPGNTLYNNLITTPSTTINATANQYYILTASATLNLPAVPSTGNMIGVTNASGALCTIQSTTANIYTVSGISTTRSLTSDTQIKLLFDGTNWYPVA